jgi:predicted Rossmann fold nucleotide-binding protein DprA/Smf involved in DNA uptake
VYHTISDTPVFIDTIADSTGFNTSAILSSLTELELYGLIRELPGKRYVRK